MGRQIGVDRLTLNVSHGGAPHTGCRRVREDTTTLKMNRDGCARLTDAAHLHSAKSHREGSAVTREIVHPDERLKVMTWF
jgi:hypothetical protein